MSRQTILNLALLGTFLALVAASLVLGADPSRKNVEVLPGMVDSVPYDAYAPNPSFADGKTLQRPPEGTIPRGRMPLHFGDGPEEALRAGRELSNPLRAPDDLEPPATLAPTDPDAPAVRAAWQETVDRARADLERGTEVYAVYCRLCHGDTGLGDGPVARRGFPAPASLLGERALEMADGRMFHLITYGGENMPPYAAQVDREDRWRAILYVRKLQREGLAAGLAPPPGATPDEPVQKAAPGSGPAPQEVTAP